MKSLLLTKPDFDFPVHSTFICSTPSIGNVGQLATDVILSTLYQKGLLERVGSIESDCILPLTGFDSFGSGSEFESHLCMPVEERISRYCEEFVDILTKIQCGKLIILTGAATDDLEVMNKCQGFQACVELERDPLPQKLNELFNKEFFNSNDFTDIAPSLLIFNESNEIDVEFSEKSQTEKRLAENDFDSFLTSSTVFSSVGNEAGIGKKILSLDGMEEGTLLFNIISKKKILNARKSIFNLTILGLFCAEGDNRPDGKKLALLVLRELDYKIEEQCLPNPSSWNVLYGAPLTADSQSMFY